MKLTQASIGAIEREFMVSHETDRIVFDEDLLGYFDCQKSDGRVVSPGRLKRSHIPRSLKHRMDQTNGK